MCTKKYILCTIFSSGKNVKGVQCYHDIVHNPECVQCELLAGEMPTFAFHVSWPCMCYASEIFSKIKYVSRVPIDTLYCFISEQESIFCKGQCEPRLSCKFFLLVHNETPLCSYISPNHRSTFLR